MHEEWSSSSPAFRRRAVGLVIADESDATLERVAVETLLETVGAHVTEKDREFPFGVEFLPTQRVLQRDRAADAGAGARGRAGALDHHEAIHARPLGTARQNALELLLRHDAWIAPKAVVAAAILLAACGDDGDPMIDLRAGAVVSLQA